MVDYKYRTSAPADVRSAEIDAGLRSYMLGVYNYMALGVAFTAIVSLFVASSPELMSIFGTRLMFWVLFAAIFGVGFLADKLIFSGNAALAHLAYWGYATLWGLWIAPAIGHYMGLDGGTMIIRAFAITAITFASMSALGYVTKKDLSAFGTFFVMATIGLLIAILVNIVFLQSTFMSLITSGLVVIVFAGITAWETQVIKQMYYEGDGAVAMKQKSIFGAFMLYGSFVVMFIHILNILGIMNSD